MISSGQNSSLQNESFEVKKAHVEAFINGSIIGSVESLKMLKIYKNSSWNDDELKEHQKEMINILIESFPNQEEFNNIRNNLNYAITN